MTPEMEKDIARWADQEREKREAASPTSAPGAFKDVRAQLKAAFESLPEKAEIPFHLTPEGERLERFKRALEDSPEFLKRIDRTLLANPAAFDRVANWDGSFPGPCACGATSTAKTRAAWSVLGRLYVRQNRAFAWFPVRRLVGELERYETAGCADQFFHQYDFFPNLFVDDVDKINWQYESNQSALFAFYDWIYRRRKPCITTTNRARKWWADKMGGAFARRMFDDAHYLVEF